MSTSDDRLAVIQDNYSNALTNEAQDLAQATTPALVAAVQANVANARATYYAAAAAALTNTDPQVEGAYTSAQAALNAVKQARSSAAQIETLLGKLNTSTTAATSLLNAAKSV
jgi:hypothetical protein